MANNIESPYKPECLAAKITDMWIKWDSSRVEWKKEKKELREYLFATDTRKTSTYQWKNSTVTPKLTQLRDNLHANYMAALFPTEDWFVWEAAEKSAASADKKEAITSYMKNKLKASNFQLLVSQLIYDYIDYGNVVVGHEFVKEVKQLEDNSSVVLYTGPKAFRVSPIDCVFNPMAASFESTPFIRRVLKSVGDLLNDVETNPTLEYDQQKIQMALDMRQNFRDDPEMMKNDGLLVDGFGTIEDYITSDAVELLEFYGHIYDNATQTLHKDVLITILDRKWVLRNKVNPSWLGRKPFFHCGWRLRPDNLWSQGPLDQLVGMQYRIDHLENLKADVFDQIAHPIVKVKGNTVEEFQFAPGAVVFTGDEGDVEFMRPDATALNADMQIAELMNRMEELAGAPKQAMGIRTPGEKTKYEVQTLENASGRIFQSKVNWFEKNILEPLLNSMFEEARRNFGAVEQIKTIDPTYGAEIFIEVTKEDLVGTGRLYPMGARHFAEQAKFVQELSQTIQTVQAIPGVAAHISGKGVAKALEDNLGWARYGIVKDNAMVFEAAETQLLQSKAMEEAQVAANIDPSAMAMNLESEEDELNIGQQSPQGV